MEGWISLHRRIKKHWIWSDNFYLRLWLDFLFRAGYEDKKMLTREGVVTLEKGEFIISQVKLAKEYHVSRSKIRTFLKLLENDQMIDQQTSNNFTKITICNYEIYQNTTTAKEQRKNSERTAKEQRKDTNNKENKENKKALIEFANEVNTETNINNQLSNSNKSKTVSFTKVDNSIDINKKAHDFALRKQKFKEELRNFGNTYSKDMLNDFFSYWTEPNRSRTKMRFELEKTWDTKRRLEYWEKRSGFHKGNGRGKTRWTENDVIEFCKRNNIPFTASGGKITGLSAEFTATFKKAEDGNWEKR